MKSALLLLVLWALEYTAFAWLAGSSVHAIVSQPDKAAIVDYFVVVLWFGAFLRVATRQ